MEMLHGLSPEQRTSRKVRLLESCEQEVLVLTGPRLCGAWSTELLQELRSCARRGLRVFVLLESGTGNGEAASLRAAGLTVRVAPKRFSWVFRPFPVHSEVWVFDRAEAITVNERAFAGASRRAGPALQLECLLGTEPARGLASYFDRRWELEGRQLSYSVRHKSFAFHGGDRAELSFYGCLLNAQREITLCVPGGRISRQVESALHGALHEGVRIELFTNADRDDAPGLRRLRRLSAAGAVVKICGHRLSSEAAVIDGHSLYLGSLPTSWHRWTRGSCPVLVMNDSLAARELLEALEEQVSVEVTGTDASAASLAFR